MKIKLVDYPKFLFYIFSITKSVLPNVYYLRLLGFQIRLDFN
jgi:hypothetical protein